MEQAMRLAAETQPWDAEMAEALLPEMKEPTPPMSPAAAAVLHDGAGEEPPLPHAERLCSEDASGAPGQQAAPAVLPPTQASPSHNLRSLLSPAAYPFKPLLSRTGGSPKARDSTHLRLALAPPLQALLSFGGSGEEDEETEASGEEEAETEEGEEAQAAATETAAQAGAEPMQAELPEQPDAAAADVSPEQDLMAGAEPAQEDEQMPEQPAEEQKVAPAETAPAGHLASADGAAATAAAAVASLPSAAAAPSEAGAPSKRSGRSAPAGAVASDMVGSTADRCRELLGEARALLLDREGGQQSSLATAERAAAWAQDLAAMQERRWAWWLSLEGSSIGWVP